MPSTTRAARGYAFVIAAAVLWGTSGVVGKTLFGEGIGPEQLVQVRVVVATPLLAGLLALGGRHRFRVRVADLPLLLAVGTALASAQFTYFFAISRIHVAAAILLQYLAPVGIAAYSVTFWQERLTAPKAVALVLAVAGCYLVVGGYDLELVRLNRAGIVGGVASAAAFGAYALLGERAMHRLSPWTVIFYAMGVAAVLLHLAFPTPDYLRHPFTASQWARLVYVGAFGTAAPYGLFLAGIGQVRATRASITATLEPITAAALAFPVLGEALEPLQLLGGAAVIAAIAVLQLAREESPLAPARLRARAAPEGGEATD